jgi:two-component sensor histidine kinase
VIDLRPIALRVSVANEVIELGRAVSLGLGHQRGPDERPQIRLPGRRGGQRDRGVSSARASNSAWRCRTTASASRPSSAAREPGTKLIRALAQQLGGSVDWEGPPGTRITLLFPAAGSS